MLLSPAGAWAWLSLAQKRWPKTKRWNKNFWTNISSLTLNKPKLQANCLSLFEPYHNLSLLQGVPQYCLQFCLVNFSASKAPRSSILPIFQHSFFCRFQNYTICDYLVKSWPRNCRNTRITKEYSQAPMSMVPRHYDIWVVVAPWHQALECSLALMSAFGNMASASSVLMVTYECSWGIINTHKQPWTAMRSNERSWAWRHKHSRTLMSAHGHFWALKSIHEQS